MSETLSLLSTETELLPAIREIAAGKVQPAEYDPDTLAEMAALLNRHYRAGAELVSDAIYDELFVGTLAALEPDHPFLHAVEPEEVVLGGSAVRHERPMLSTDKCYSELELSRFFAKVEDAAKRLGLDTSTLTYRATAKLDGIAGMDRVDGRLVTRGDGLTGTDITRAFEHGMHAHGGRGQGLGELVLNQAFFEQEIAEAFGMMHPRNFVTGFVGSDVPKAHHEGALAAKAIVFMPYGQLPCWTGGAQAFLSDWESIVRNLRAEVPYLTDGVVLEVTDKNLQDAMGATSHHNRWQVAIKTKGEVARTRVRNIRLQTGRTGRVTPVLEIEPVLLSGARISNVTAHTASALAELGLGIGAEVEITRAGDVIPKLERVVTPAAEPMRVDTCPSCGHALETEGPYQVCPNTTGCPAQGESRLEHFWKTLGNCDLFGPRTVQQLVASNFTALPAVYALDEEAFRTMGFGPGQSRNLVSELRRSRTDSVQDWRFLAAFGIRHLGRGDARKLLARFPLESLETIKADDILSVSGFGPLTAPAIAQSLHEGWGVMRTMLDLGFNLERTPIADENPVPNEGPLSGEFIVFTGKLVSGSREALEEQAAALGAQVQSSINGKTTLLVCGEKAGSKRAKAEGINQKAGRTVVRILDEQEYCERIAGL